MRRVLCCLAVLVVSVGAAGQWHPPERPKAVPPKSVEEARTWLLRAQELWTKDVYTLSKQLDTAADRKRLRDQWTADKSRLAYLKETLPAWDPLKPYAGLPEAERERFARSYFAMLMEHILDVQNAISQVKETRGSAGALKAYQAAQGSLASAIPNEHPYAPALDPDETGSIGRLGTVKVQQIQGDAILGELDGEDVWVEGVRTGGLADGDNVSGQGRWKVTGTKTYTTVLGASRTVRKIERFAWPK